MQILIENELLISLQKIISDLEKTGDWATTDAYSNKLNLVLEMKCRKDHWEDILLEHHKYNELLLSKFNNKRYVVSTPKGVYSWDITKLENLEWKMKWLPKNSKKIKSEYGWRLATYVPIIEATTITKLLGYE